MRVLIMLAAMLAFMSTASAQVVNPCGPHKGLVERLRNNFDEVKRAEAMVAGNALLLEIYVSQTPGTNGHTYTALIVYPAGKACIVSAGANWQFLAAPTLPGKTHF